jgi:hypothetical protein
MDVMVLYAFGVGLSNFGMGRDPSPREIVEAVRAELPVVASYGATGNIAFDDISVEAARQVLRNRTPVDWALVTARRLDHGLVVLDELPEVAHADDERPTPGLAFAVYAAGPGDVENTWRADLRRIGRNMVAVRKLDLVVGGELDRNRRGGWGGVSHDIGLQLGGRWTARSRRTIDGLRNRAIGQR